MNDFLNQIRHLVGHVPFTKDAVALYFCMIDPQTPLPAKATIAGALAYFLLPADAIPDVIAGLGFTDDASVIATTLVAVSTCITDKHKQQASEFFVA